MNDKYEVWDESEHLLNAKDFNKEFKKTCEEFNNIKNKRECKKFSMSWGCER